MLRPFFALTVTLAFAMSVRAATPPNVIIISIDTLRSDRLPAYGYRAIVTPQLDRFRADAVLFERAWSPVPLTAPAHATLLTGRLPAQHGIRDNTGHVLDRSVSTLGEELGRRGYVSAAMVSTKVLAAKGGLWRGFNRYDDSLDQGAAEREGGSSVDAALQWIGAQKKRPFFLLLHLYEPHTPRRTMTGIADPYDAEIVRVDALVGRFLDELRRRRLYDSSLIFFLSDHGEGLGEHGENQHGVLLYREALQVPLLMKLPGNDRRGTRVTADAQLLDVAPTILQFAGAADRTRTLPGRSLTILGTGSRAIYGETLYPRFQLGWAETHSLVQGSFHLIAGRRVELYDLRADPRERTNLVDTQRRVAVAMLRQLRTMTAPAKAPPKIAPDDELLALGYLSGGADETLFRPHPADRIAIFNRTLTLMIALRHERFREGLRIAEEILKEHPTFPEVWERKAQALLGLGRRADAETALREAARLTRAR